MFRVLLVLDIFNNCVVHAVRGQRDKYVPISNFSNICTTSDPIEIINELVPDEVYIADLNRLQNKGRQDANSAAITEISQKTDTLLDYAITSMDEVADAMKLADTVVLGTETATFKTIKEAASEFPKQISVSIDMINGKVLKYDSGISENPLDIIEELNDLDICDIIFLDLYKVGTSSGVDTELIGKMASISSHKMLLGGGVRNCEDIKNISESGFSGALVSTAIHNGSIPLSVLYQNR